MTRPMMLTLLAATIAMGFTSPSIAGSRGGDAPAPAHQQPRAVPTQGAKDTPPPVEERQLPLPSGCPLREGKLELIA